MYCQRDRTPDIFDSNKELEKSYSIQLFSIVKDFFPITKQIIPELLIQWKALHQSFRIELENIEFILQKESHFSSITAISRPKRPSRRAKNAQKKTTATSSFP